MTTPQPNTVTTLPCSCGSVEVEVTGAPILAAACYCDDCQSGARLLEALPNARPVMDPDGGTPYVLYRRDRVACTRGEPLLHRHRLRPDSATNRVVASCCNTAMFVSYDRGPHWTSLYQGRFGADAPPMEMRVNTRFKPAGAVLTLDIPSYGTFPLRFVAKLAAARIAMLFG